MRRSYILTAFITGFAGLLLMVGCEKIQERNILRGKFELLYAEVDHSGQNFLEIMLPGYSSNPTDYRYFIDFKENDIMEATYYAFDTVSYHVVGEWEMRGRNHLYMKIDRVINGEFHFKREGHKQWKLTCPDNIARFLTDTVIVHLELLIEKHRN